MSDAAGGRTIRDAVAIALEGVPGSPIAAISFARPEHLRDYVLRWVHEYAARRGVLLSDSDITSELQRIVSDLHRKLAP